MLSENLESQIEIHCCHFLHGLYPWDQNFLVSPYWRLYWNSTPGAWIRLDDKEFELSAEYIYIVPGHLRFVTFATQPFDHFFVHFKLCDRLPLLNRIYRIPADPGILLLIRDFDQRGRNEGNELWANCCAFAIVSHSLLRLDPELLRLPMRLAPRIEKVCARIKRHPDQHLNNGQLARIAGLDRSAFVRLFHREIGETPQCYSRRVRIDRACELLNLSAQSIDEIATATGFADRYHFGRVFHQVLGMAPATYRRNIRLKDNISDALSHIKTKAKEHSRSSGK